MKTIKIDDVEYIKKSDIKTLEIPDTDFVIIRTYSAGVFAGNLKSRKDKEVVLNNAIRIHYWSGAASLSQMALEGVKKPSECRFALPLPEIILTESIEIIKCTEKGMKNIIGVKPWQV